MGYYAEGNGRVRFKRVLSDAEIDTLIGVLEDTYFEHDFSKNVHASTVSFWRYDKYHSEDVETLLNCLKDKFPVADGYLEYSGEDGEHWRFIFIDGVWREQIGRVVYEDC